MAMIRTVLIPLFFAICATNGNEVVSDLDSPREIRKVITLIEEMKVTVEKEAKDDEASYNKYKCWADTETERATAAVEKNSATVDQLTAFLEESLALEQKLIAEIEQLTKDIAEAQDAIAEATEIREKEKAAFLAAEADMKETVSALYDAVDVLSKVQLTQTKKQSVRKISLVQIDKVTKVINHRFPRFRGQLQKDLFDVLSSLAPSGFLSGGSASLDQVSQRLLPGRELLPWEKSAEQIGKEEKPNDLKGMAAGAKSYNARSGQILGMLTEMLDEFSRDLAAAQKADFIAEVQFQNLNAAKLAEIAAATAQKEAKEKQLKELQRAIAKAKEDLETLTEALENDKAFLADVDERLKTQTAEYEQRVKDRDLEIVALAETLKILTADEARDLYAKTSLSFLQVDSVSESRVAAQDRAAEKAMLRIAKVATAHKNWALAALGVRIRLDSFEKVKKMMDKMLVDLKKQQKDEYEKVEKCKLDIDQTEDKIWDATNVKEDLAELHKELVNKIEKLTAEIAELKAEEEATEVALKQAGEQRKEENQLFQTSVADQRACINILNKATQRLKDFYGKPPGEGLVQTNGRPAKEALRKSGWSGAKQPPSEPADYEKSGLGGGVVEMLMSISADAGRVEAELVKDENEAQNEYGKAAQQMTDLILADRKAIADKQAEKAETEAKKAETEEAQLANEKELTSLKKLLAGFHAECDYIIKYFKIRQTARQQEMDAISEAKAILSGSKFS